MKILHNKHQACIDACMKCTQACFECFKMCLEEADVQARKNCIAILVECAMICQQAVASISMNGQFANDFCKLCASVCEKCAQECEMFKDDHCQQCADMCRKCAEECRKMAGM